MKRHASSRHVSWVGIAGVIVLAACGGESGGGDLPTARPLGPDGANLRDGVYSPDGSQIVYWAEQADSDQLQVAGTDLATPRVLASNAAGVRLPPPTWSPDGRTIAFSMVGNGLSDVWIVPVDSGPARAATKAPGIEVAWVWDPAGGRLAYQATTQGGGVTSRVLNTTTLASTPMFSETRPAYGFWSPDGSMIVYNMAEGDGVFTLWLADGTGGNARKLTTEGFEDLPDVLPWSPDGTRFLYTSRRTGTRDIWVMPVAGGEPLQLTHDVRDDYAPAWSPDGSWVAFLSDRGRQTDVWLVAAEGGTEVRVTDDTDVETSLRWRPGTNELKYEVLTQREALWARSLADGSERRLTTDPVRMHMFDLAPDGSQVVAPVVRGGGVLDLVVTPVADGPSRTLASATNRDQIVLDWSPDGSAIVFNSTQAGSEDIWLVDAAGGAPRALTTWPSSENNPRWTPDGSGVYFLSDHESGLLPDLWLVPAAGGDPRRITRGGKVLAAELIPHSPDLVLTVLGDKAGEFTLQRSTPDGTLHQLWNRSNTFGGPVSPDGTRMAISTIEADGSRPTWLLSLVTGESRQILRTGEQPLDWSPDGSRLLYTVGGAVPDLSILTIADSTVERVTTTPDRREWGVRWMPDGKSIVIAAGTSQNRMLTVDVKKLIGR